MQECDAGSGVGQCTGCVAGSRAGSSGSSSWPGCVRPALGPCGAGHMRAGMAWLAVDSGSASTTGVVARPDGTLLFHGEFGVAHQGGSGPVRDARATVWRPGPGIQNEGTECPFTGIR